MSQNNYLPSIPNRILLLIFTIDLLSVILQEFDAVPKFFYTAVYSYALMYFKVEFFTKNGTFMNSKLFDYTMYLAPVVFFAILFKIQHYPGADMLFSIVFVVILIAYLIHFIQKKDKEALDYFKLIWLVVALYGVSSTMAHSPYAVEFSLVSAIGFYLLIPVISLRQMKLNPSWLND